MLQQLLSLSVLLFSSLSFAGEHHFFEDPEHFFNESLACRKPNKSQRRSVNAGNKKREKLLQRCINETANSRWCEQLLRPNPYSKKTFQCTYGQKQPHQLIHPNEKTWQYPITAVNIIEELESKGIEACLLYNWWRPEPYNRNVGGSPSRHPYGTSVDVYFCSRDDQNKAFKELCKMRKMGRVRAIGFYWGSSNSPSYALHLGIGDRRANTWGKSCP